LLIGFVGIVEERVDSRMKLRFWLRQLVKFTEMEKTEKNGFCRKKWGDELYLDVLSLGYLCIIQVKMSSICFRKGERHLC